MPARIAAQPKGAKPWCAVRFEKPGLDGLPTPSSQDARDHDEHDDGGDLDRREPEFELAVGARRGEIHRGEQRHEPEADLPDLEHGQPGMHGLRAGDAPRWPTTTTQNHQYSQPVMNPAPLPRPARTYSVNEPRPG